MKTQQNNTTTPPPAPQDTAHTNLALSPLPWPGAFHYMMCSPSNCKRMGCLEDCCQKTGTVVWGDKTLGLGDVCLLGRDSLGPSLHLQHQPKYLWPGQCLPAHSWAGPNEEAELAAGEMEPHQCHPQRWGLGDRGPRQRTEAAWEAGAEQKMKPRFLRLLLPDPLPHPHVAPLVFINSRT